VKKQNEGSAAEKRVKQRKMLEVRKRGQSPFSAEQEMGTVPVSVASRGVSQVSAIDDLIFELDRAITDKDIAAVRRIYADNAPDSEARRK
jgi:hypothetical protein